MKISLHQKPKRIKLTNIFLSGMMDTVCNDLNLSTGKIAFIFSNKQEMSQLHGQYFDDNTPTDVITFNLGDEDIESEIYIGWETALEQSKQYQVSLENEILRLMIHGILHLKGMNDDTEDQMIVMKQEEDRLLNILQLRIENNA